MYVSTGSSGKQKGARIAAATTMRAAHTGLIHCHRGAASQRLPEDPSRGKQHRECRPGIVDARVHSHDQNQRGQKRPTQDAERLALFAEQVIPEPGQPDGQREREHSEDFLADERQRRQIHIAVRAPDIRLQFQEREMMLHVPQQVGQEEQKGERAR